MASSVTPETHVRPAALTGWRLLLTRPALMPYNRLVVLVLALNAVVAGIIATTSASMPSDDAATLLITMSGVNLAAAVLIRQQYVINLLFRLATSVPKSAPLAVRRRLAKVYHFGGIHVGAAVAAVGWFLGGAATVVFSDSFSVFSKGVAVALVACLVGILVPALPPIRQRRHDLFEMTHRFGGWSALTLFAVLTVALAADAADSAGAAGIGRVLAASPSFWLLLVIVLSVVAPWLRLRKVPVRIATPSSHVALADFDHGVRPFAGSSTTLARHPLGQWHSFANVVTRDETGFRLTISRAGDWTGRLIDDAPSHVWTRGIPTAGVGNVDKLFERVVWVATGSGIGPCLPHLFADTTPSKLVWATREPEATYSNDLVESIRASHPDAVIWNTSEQGRPDLVALALEEFTSFDAEAVICISNQSTTRRVVSALEALGVPAYGAIWDS
ncbi:hypothetical protein LJR042_002135 [Microbacterium maritypicum]|uniref:hypothetical protein n=1 Tax=Microbacterium TaxID=33882 RepID=UPI00142210FD|nr:MULTISPECIES: hypothetical protein [Microbacterium]NIG64706.1 hypothetical protein [Microbacterium sp. Be9]